MSDYLTDRNLFDGEARLILIIERLLVRNTNYIEKSNAEIAEAANSTKTAIRKMLSKLVKKGYIKSDGNRKKRKIYIIK